MFFFRKKKEPVKLWFTTDIHCHVVPGVDDGSPDAGTSARLVQGLYDLGIRRIIATPHVTQATFENTPQTLASPIAELRKALADNAIDVDIRTTAEYRVDEFFEQQIANGTLMPYPDNYLLIENSFIQEPWNLEQLIFDLQVKGYKLIMAHPERYLYYHTRPQRYQELKQLGIDFQVNLLSLAGYYGKNEKRMAERLVEAGMVDFMGTDTHGFRHLECFGNYLSSREAERHARLLDGKIKNSIFD